MPAIRPAISFYPAYRGVVSADGHRPDDGSTIVTLTVSPTSRFLIARPLVWLISLPFTKLTPRAMKAFAASIERDSDELGGPGVGDA